MRIRLMEPDTLDNPYSIMSYDRAREQLRSLNNMNLAKQLIWSEGNGPEEIMAILVINYLYENLSL